MQPKISKIWHQLETQRIDLLQELSKYDAPILNKKPNPNAWSVLQVLHHLMASEAASLAYLRKKLSYSSQVPKAGLKSSFRRFTLRLAFSLPVKFKAPANLETFPNVSDFNEMKLRWASQRLDLQEFIEYLPDNVLEGEIWRHQIMGKMNIEQMLNFFHSHVERHRGQIKKTLYA